MKAKKGCVAVTLGSGGGGDADAVDCQKFTIPISYLHHPGFRSLLERAQEVFGFHGEGPVRLPCSVEEFLHLRWMIEREEKAERLRYYRQHHQHHHHLYQSLPFLSCSRIVT